MLRMRHYPVRRWVAVAQAACALAAGLRLCWAPAIAASPSDYTAAIQSFEEIVQQELQRKLITGVSVAFVDDQTLVYSRGFGFADKKRRRPAQPDTVYRAGSISKLFTALAAMRLVERGRLDIDCSISKYLPELNLVSPFPDAGPVTLRQLMCHRSGLVRECPVGSYFDDSEPGTSKTVASLSGCVLIYPPGTKTKYSNSGVTIVGHVLETIAGEPFDKWLQRDLFHPLGLTSSSYLLDASLKPRLAVGYLPVAGPQGGFNEIAAPQFELGTIPAGNLYTTAPDLARLLSCLFALGRAGSSNLLTLETLNAMFTPQLTADTNGFGLGFSISHFRRYKIFSHSGAVYGFTSMFIGVPQEKIGVVILCNDDLAIGPVRKLANAALDLMLETKTGQPRPAPVPTCPLTLEQLELFTGEFESESFWAEIKAQPGFLEATISGQPLHFRPVATNRFEANGRAAHQAPVQFELDGQEGARRFTLFNQQFQRIEPNTPPRVPDHWQKYLGSYGPAFIPLIISIKRGHLYAMTENEFDYRLWPINRTVFKMPPGLYTDEQLVFQLTARGRVHTAVLANMPLQRRTP